MDFECPHCGYQFSPEEEHFEEKTHNITCPGCKKGFLLDASCSWDFDTRCLLQDHRWVRTEQSVGNGLYLPDGWVRCKNCGVNFKEDKLPPNTAIGK